MPFGPCLDILGHYVAHFGGPGRQKWSYKSGHCGCKHSFKGSLLLTTPAPLIWVDSEGISGIVSRCLSQGGSPLAGLAGDFLSTAGNGSTPRRVAVSGAM